MSITNSHNLKHLQVRKCKIEEELQYIQVERERYSTRIHELKNELNIIVTKINSLNKKEPTISEHELLRYVERVMGIDLEDVKKHMLTPQNLKLIEFADNCTIKCNGVDFIVKDRCIVTE